jgi:DNA invertase Pin-like site-specific DNA recombinase
MRTKAFSYLRVSGKGQIAGDGFPRQRDKVERFAKKHRFEIAQEFRDEGVSGTKDAFERPGLTELLIALKSNGVRTVLIEDAHRLARDLVVSEILLREFRDIGVNVISADSGTELTVEDDEPSRKLIRQILGAVSEWEKSIVVQKLRAARNRMRKSGARCEGRKPYGITSDEREIIAKILDLKQKGNSFAVIAANLNREGVQPRKSTRAGKQAKWHSTMISRILVRER